MLFIVSLTAYLFIYLLGSIVTTGIRTATDLARKPRVCLLLGHSLRSTQIMQVSEEAASPRSLSSCQANLLVLHLLLQYFALALACCVTSLGTYLLGPVSI